MRRIGIVVNPIAGMGGRVGLKGTDGKVAAARARGAESRAPGRAREALDSLAEHAIDIDLLAAGGAMGADVAREAGFDPTVVTQPGTETTAADTREAVAAFLEHASDESDDGASADDESTGHASDAADATDTTPTGVDLVLFVGGDGTAVDVAETLSGAESDVPMLGVPAGVKVYSSVFAVSPRAAGRVAATFSDTETGEVNDIDEDAYREGEVHTDLRALARVPVADERQSAKQLAGGTVEALAAGVVADIEPGTTYVLGPGSTIGAIADALGVEGSPLGVDVWRATESVEGRGTDQPPPGELVVRDGSADEIRGALSGPAVILVSPIGGQGFVFGRGNHQIAPDVIRAAEVEIVGSRRKLDGIGVLRVDTGDADLDEDLRGWRKVRVGRVERRLMQVV